MAQELESLPGRHGTHAQAGFEHLTQVGVARQITGVRDSAPSDGGGGQAQAAPVARQRLQERVAGRIIGLSGNTEGGRHRGVEYEEIERRVEREPVQIPGAQDLGARGAPESLRGHGG